MPSAAAPARSNKLFIVHLIAVSPLNVP